MADYENTLVITPEQLEAIADANLLLNGISRTNPEWDRYQKIIASFYEMVQKQIARNQASETET